MTPVEEWLTVGRLDASLALLTTKNHHVIEFPTMLLPDNIKAGTIVKIQVSEDQELEKQELKQFELLQDEILEKYGTHRPQTPVLRSINVTQTSGVLGWDPIELGSSQLKSLVLYKDGLRSLMIPNPFKTTATKISGLSVDSEYTFQLKLSTTSGDLWSEKIVLHTHKMTDMSGITACLGALEGVENVTKSHIEACLQNIGAKPLQSRVSIDTTHFISNDKESDDVEFQKAQQSNIPIVRPEWVRACELERRIVGVRGFYLDADPSNIEGYRFTKLPSETSQPHSNDQQKNSSIPEQPEGTSAQGEPSQRDLSTQSTGMSNASIKSGLEASPSQTGKSEVIASDVSETPLPSDVEKPLPIEETTPAEAPENLDAVEQEQGLESKDATEDTVEIEEKAEKSNDYQTEVNEAEDSLEGSSKLPEEPKSLNVDSELQNGVTSDNTHHDEEVVGEGEVTTDEPAETSEIIKQADGPEDAHIAEQERENEATKITINAETSPQPQPVEEEIVTGPSETLQAEPSVELSDEKGESRDVEAAHNIEPEEPDSLLNTNQEGSVTAAVEFNGASDLDQEASISSPVEPPADITSVEPPATVVITEPSAEVDQDTSAQEVAVESTPEIGNDTAAEVANGAPLAIEKKKNKKNKKKGKK
ncbi:LAME_0H02938g1_1 [Lachancea meyersii CBS 8951]|uniref:Chitin biosynthesis protein CHS5 n=1 Tax=Lachancea meyersii CBS 8951 TaxID=1266667 RepID=A0A1G4KDI0_9SACH|nr:LAME_0H02938g1_1 [Lachancea meyersii CBS 8951]